MQTPSSLRRLMRPVGLAVLAVAVCLVAFWILDRTLRSRAIADEQAAARNDAAILATSLESELDKFSLLPMTLAEDPQVKQLVAGRSAEAPSLDRRLEALAARSDAAAIYVMDASGQTLVSSNWNLPTSFVGSDYAFRRYFSDAMKGGSATQFALGTVSRKPGLYIAARINSPDGPLGVVAVKTEFDRAEANWRRATEGVYVTDADGVVLLASEEAWRFHLTDGASTASRDRAQDQLQFGVSRLRPLRIASPESRAEIVQVPLVEARQSLGPPGWSLHLLVDPGPRMAAAVATGRLVLVLLLGTVVAAALLYLMLRRRRAARQEAIIEERTRTLRDQLLQANRLATLGQISAGVNHEIGQPVAALRVYAEAGEKLLGAGRSDEAALNFRQIVGLADRIGRITGELRRFSRRQPGEKRVVAIGEIIDGAMLLLRDRIVARGHAVELPPAELRCVNVAAEHVRLEQVLVNLLQNALDATGPDDRIAIAIALEDRLLRLRLIDEGVGITAEHATRLFQPFATSKEDGLGLGLVIARDIMRDLGGDLVFEEGEATCFAMIIPRAGDTHDAQGQPSGGKA